MRFPETSIENLRGLGYTEDEARFLYLVATHSGYFSTRQYLEFTVAKSGEKSMAFTQKVLGKGHATARLLLRNGRVYHLFSRLVYRAIGRENLRNRREHSAEHIRTKLAILDFVLAHLDYRYLETEAEKVDYFCGKLEISRAFLPAKRYSGAIRQKTTDRYFVDKFPLFIVPESSSSPYRASTRNFYRDILRRHLVPRFAQCRLCDICTPELQIFLNHKAERYAPSVLHHVRATMSRVCGSAKEWGYLENNPAGGVRLPHKHPVQPKVTFQPGDLQMVLNHLEEPHRTLVFLIAVTGMRVSELLALQWSDIDFERRLLYVRRTFYRGNFGIPKTHTSERVLPISDGLSYALQQHRQRVRRSAMDLVFPNAHGKPYEAANLLRRLLHPVLTKCGLPRTGWRVFRRSVATALSEMREPVRTTQQVLGHSSPHTTLAFYTQSVEDSQRSAISKLERILFPNVPKFEGGPSLIH